LPLGTASPGWGCCVAGSAWTASRRRSTRDFCRRCSNEGGPSYLATGRCPATKNPVGAIPLGFESLLRHADQTGPRTSREPQQNPDAEWGPTGPIRLENPGAPARLTARGLGLVRQPSGVAAEATHLTPNPPRELAQSCPFALCTVALRGRRIGRVSRTGVGASDLGRVTTCWTHRRSRSAVTPWP
jgi:hypothetical protein